MRYTWRVKPASGNMLEECLNDLAAEGYDIFKITSDGTMQVRNALDPNKQTIMPLFTVIARKAVYGVTDA